jgi:hypothetical protein
MIQVQTVPDNYFYQIWPVIEPMFERAVAASIGDTTLESLKLSIVNKYQTLLVAVKDNRIIGAATIKLENHPNNRIAYITALGGRGIVDKEVFNQVEQWAKANGATKIRALAKESQTRLYKQKAGLIPVTQLLEKSI